MDTRKRRGTALKEKKVPSCINAFSLISDAIPESLGECAHPHTPRLTHRNIVLDYNVLTAKSLISEVGLGTVGFKRLSKAEYEMTSRE
jgi:hypothetical protein